MGLLTDFYVAPRAHANGILDGSKRKGAPGVEYKRVDTVKLDSLGRILAAELGREATKLRFEMLTAEEADHWVFVVPAELVDLLAAARASIAPAASAWAATAELKMDRFKLEDAKEVIASLAKLAMQAKNSKKDLLLYMSL